MQHIISILLENESGALSRVAGLFSARGYNIESLSVAATEDPSLARMTLVTRGSDEMIEQILKQLNKLIEVIKVLDLSEGPHIEREIMLVKLRTQEGGEETIQRLTDIFRGRIVDVGECTYTVELTGDAGKLDAFLRAVDSKRILEVVRSGLLGIARGEKSLRV